VVILGRSLIRTSNAGGILFNARVSTSFWLPSLSENRFSSSMVATMLSRCSYSVPTKVSRRVIRSRTASWRPDSATLKL
jgi:hypothetical protein